jgi:hypothetical protein
MMYVKLCGEYSYFSVIPWNSFVSSLSIAGIGTSTLLVVRSTSEHHFVQLLYRLFQSSIITYFCLECFCTIRHVKKTKFSETSYFLRIIRRCITL